MSQEPDTTPLAFATVQQLVEELMGRCAAGVIGLYRQTPNGEFVTATRSKGHEVICTGLAETLRSLNLETYSARRPSATDED